MLFDSSIIFKMGYVHGRPEFLAIDKEGNPYLIEEVKKKIVLTPTVMDKARLEKFRPITMPMLINMIQGRTIAFPSP